MFVEIIYLDLADIIMFYCDYNITMNILDIHIGIFNVQIGRKALHSLGECDWWDKMYLIACTSFVSCLLL